MPVIAGFPLNFNCVPFLTIYDRVLRSACLAIRRRIIVVLYEKYTRVIVRFNNNIVRLRYDFFF